MKEIDNKLEDIKDKLNDLKMGILIVLFMLGVIFGFVCQDAKGFWDIPKDRLPPSGNWYEWEKVQVLNALDSSWYSYEIIEAWTRVPKLTWWERSSKVVATVAGAVPTLGLVLALLRRKAPQRD